MAATSIYHGGLALSLQLASVSGTAAELCVRHEGNAISYKQRVGGSQKTIVERLELVYRIDIATVVYTLELNCVAVLELVRVHWVNRVRLIEITLGQLPYRYYYTNPY